VKSSPVCLASRSSIRNWASDYFDQVSAFCYVLQLESATISPTKRFAVMRAFTQQTEQISPDSAGHFIVSILLALLFSPTAFRRPFTFEYPTRVVAGLRYESDRLSP
jgi:hypothetical protein